MRHFVLKAFFPIYEHSTPRVFIQREFDLGFLMPYFRPFRSSPPINTNRYIQWMDRIEAVKGETWKEQVIFDLIQLSREKIKYNANMLLAAIHFWESSTHTFQIPCGMITPTLFDIAAITGLRPTGQTYDPTKFKN